MRLFTVITVCFFSTFISCKSGSAQEEIDYQLKDVLQKAETTEKKLNNVREKIVRLSEIAVLYGKSGDRTAARVRIQQCLKLASTITDPMTRFQIQIVIVEAQSGYGDYIEAHRNVEKHVQDDFKSSLRFIVVSAATANENLESALEIAKTITNEQRRDWSYSGIAHTWAIQGNLEQAFKIANKINSQTYKSIAYLLVIEALLEKGKTDYAKKTVNRIKEHPFKFRALREIASAQLKVGKKKDALETIQEAEQFANSPSDKISLILLEVEAGKGEIEKAFKLAKVISEKETRSIELAAIVLALTKNRGAQHAFRFLQKRNVPISAIRKSGHFISEIALAESRRINGEAGVKIVETINPYCSEYNLAMKVIATHEAEQGRFETALKINAKIEDLYEKIVGLKEISLRQYQKEKKIDARKTLLLAIQSAKGVEIGGGSDVILLTELAIAQVKIDDVQEAKKSFQLAITKAEKYPEQSYRGLLIGNVLEAQTRAMGKTFTLKQALAFQSPVIRSQALIGVAKGMLDRTSKNKLK